MTLRIALACLLVFTPCVSACGGSQSAAQPSGDGQSGGAASIAANPNPLPSGDGLGTTTITWKTGDGSQVQVCVSQDGGSENLFDSGTDGSKDAPWIQSGSTCEFKLFAGSDHRTQLTSVKVTRAQ